MNVLIATDGSAQAHHAIREAMRLLPLASAHVTVVSVINPVAITPVYENIGLGSTLVAEQLSASARGFLKTAKAILAEGGIEATLVEREGEPAAQVRALAEELHADVVVVGSHGAGALERLVLGSMCGHLVQHCPGTVMVVRPPAGPRS